jgi:hypothetical protein
MPNKPTGILRWQYVLGYLVLVVAFVYVVYQQERQQNQIQDIVHSNQAVICAQKANAEEQLAETRGFLAHHPHGIPGISRADLQTTITRQEEFVAAFADAKC